MSNCKHTKTTSGRDYGFTGPVAVEPYTYENRAAHGGITYTVTCSDCGAEKQVNSNGNHIEESPWGPSRASREAQAKREWDAKVSAQHKKFPILAATNTAVRHVTLAGDIQIERDGRIIYARKSEVEAAAKQEDIGDGLPQYYAAILGAAGVK